MRCSLVLTVIGPDRTGLIETIAQTAAEHGGNWVESRMARLAGQFAGILLIDAPHERCAALAEALRALESKGLHVAVEAVEAEDLPAGSAATATSSAASPDARTMRFELIGQDRPGIIRDVSHVLARRGVNVVDLQTQVLSAPMSGEPLFKAVAQLHLPAADAVEQVRDALEAIANDLMVDIAFDEPAEADGAR